MSGFATLAAVNPALRVLAMTAALAVPHLAGAMEQLVIPRIVADAAEQNSPTVSFSIPHFTLSQEEREIIAACLVLEAASQGPYGMRAVMAVIRNRAHGQPELLAPTVLREKQFSAFNALTAGRESLARVIQRAKRDPMWAAAIYVVDDALAETWHDPTDGATHYTRSAERTAWTRSLAKTVTIGAHSFYR